MVLAFDMMNCIRIVTMTIKASTYFAGNRYKYPFPSSDQRMTRSFARKSPPNQRSPDGEMTLQSTVKSPKTKKNILLITYTHR